MPKTSKSPSPGRSKSPQSVPRISRVRPFKPVRSFGETLGNSITLSPTAYAPVDYPFFATTPEQTPGAGPSYTLDLLATPTRLSDNWNFDNLASLQPDPDFTAINFDDALNGIDFDNPVFKMTLADSAFAVGSALDSTDDQTTPTPAASATLPDDALPAFPDLLSAPTASNVDSVAPSSLQAPIPAPVVPAPVANSVATTDPAPVTAPTPSTKPVTASTAPATTESSATVAAKDEAKAEASDAPAVKSEALPEAVPQPQSTQVASSAGTEDKTKKVTVAPPKRKIVRKRRRDDRDDKYAWPLDDPDPKVDYAYHAGHKVWDEAPLPTTKDGWYSFTTKECNDVLVEVDYTNEADMLQKMQEEGLTKTASKKKHLPDEARTYMKCRICLVLLEIDKKNVDRHVNSLRHTEQLATLVKHPLLRHMWHCDYCGTLVRHGGEKAHLRDCQAKPKSPPPNQESEEPLAKRRQIVDYEGQTENMLPSHSHPRSRLPARYRPAQPTDTTPFMQSFAPYPDFAFYPQLPVMSSAPSNPFAAAANPPRIALPSLPEMHRSDIVPMTASRYPELDPRLLEPSQPPPREAEARSRTPVNQFTQVINVFPSSDAFWTDGAASGTDPSTSSTSIPVQSSRFNSSIH